MLRVKDGGGNKRTFNQLDQAEFRTERGIRQGFFFLGNQLNRELSRQMLEKNKRGRVYIRRTRSGARRRHKSSAPGQTPANMTGNMRKHRGYQVRGADQMEWGIRDGADYAVFLEKGTRKMRPRPGLKNTIRATQRDGQTGFERELEAALKK